MDIKSSYPKALSLVYFRNFKFFVRFDLFLLLDLIPCKDFTDKGVEDGMRTFYLAMTSSGMSNWSLVLLGEIHVLIY